jgi:hypothetical protein
MAATRSMEYAKGLTPGSKQTAPGLGLSATQYQTRIFE